MASTLERAFVKLESVIEQYCSEKKKGKALALVVEASFYAEDFPQNADIEKAVALVKRAETYMTDEGKPYYEQARERVITQLMALHKQKGE